MSLVEVLASIEFGSFLFWYFFAIVGLFGVCIGSFLNVLVFRIPKEEEFVKTSSHCQSFNHVLKWYDNIPLLSYILLRGKCRYCKAHISIQYPIVEGVNALLWLCIYLKYGVSLETLIYCLLTSSLLALSIIDERYFRIPNQFNIFNGFLGVVMCIVGIMQGNNGASHFIGMFSISSFLMLLYFITGGKGIGAGDIKLMMTCGLVVGWKMIIIGFLLGCILAIIIHIIRMKVSNKTHKLAFGPYLSMGIFLSMFIGEFLMNLYLSMLGVV